MLVSELQTGPGGGRRSRELTDSKTTQGPRGFVDTSMKARFSAA
jgi:hypothetical protein